MDAEIGLKRIFAEWYISKAEPLFSGSEVSVFLFIIPSLMDLVPENNGPIISKGPIEESSHPMGPLWASAVCSHGEVME